MATPDPNCPVSPAEDAVRYLLQRIKSSEKLRNLMAGTEAMNRLCKAEAIRTGRTPEEIEELYCPF